MAIYQVPERMKILAQSAPPVTTLTAVYTVPAGITARVSTIVVCNRAATNTTFRISVATAGAADALSQYICYDTPISGNDTVMLSDSLSMAATDVCRVYAGNGNLTFQFFGAEVG